VSGATGAEHRWEARGRLSDVESAAVAALVQTERWGHDVELDDAEPDPATRWGEVVLGD
jgi:hypothetical protein